MESDGRSMEYSHAQSTANHKKLPLLVCGNSFNFSQKDTQIQCCPEMRKKTKWIRKMKRTMKKPPVVACGVEKRKN